MLIKAEFPTIRGRVERQWIFALCALAALAIVLLAFQEWPGMSASTFVALGDAGYAQCLSNGWHEGMAGCFTNLGQPLGGVRATGLPGAALAAAMFGWDGAITFGEAQLVSALFTTIAFGGALLLFRRVASSKWVALLGAVVYLLAPIVSQQGSYGALRTGYALLPFYLLVDSALFGLGDKRWRTRWAIVIAVILVRVFAVLCDGYSFVMSGGLALCFYCVSGLSTRRIGTAGIAIATYLLACAIAYGSYFLFVPGAQSGLGVMPIDFFRGQGVDLYTVFVPSPLFWIYRSLGAAFDFPAAAAFGDGSNVGFNFAGYALLLSAVVVLLVRIQGKLKLGALLTSLALSGLVAFVLSLGPSLKYKDFEPAAATEPAHFSTYLMPADKALASLGTGDIYLSVPGVRNIRALARWQGVVHFALVAFLLALVSWLLERKRTALAGMLALAAVMEASPNLADAYRDGKGSQLFGRAESAVARRAGADDVRDRYLPDLSRLAQPHERALLVQVHDGAESNHYLADYLCPAANLRCYNIGGDKALEIVRDAWPREVEELLARRNIAFNIRQLFLERKVDVVLVTLFDLRRPEWANDAVHVDRNAVKQRVAAITASGDYSRVDGNYFISLRPSAKLLQGHECGADCWRGWPEVDAAGRVIDWGPRSEVKGQGFNRQVNGRSALWVRVKGDPDRYAISFGGQLLATSSGNGAVTALLPTRFERGLLASRSYNVEVVDVRDSKRIPLGDFHVDAPPDKN